MKKRYTIRYAWTYDMVVEIDLDVMTEAKLHEINNFWSEAEYRLRAARGDILQAVLKMLGLRAFYTTLTELDAEGMWRTNPPEGWPLLDGSAGILLVSLDEFELDEDEITIKSEDAA